MLILLPPSEGKNQASGEKVLDLSLLRFPKELTDLRRRAITSHDSAILDSHASPAIEVYSGVLYQALDWQSLGTAAKKRGRNELLIVSALYGVLSPDDPIAPYKAKLKSSYWKPAISSVLDALNPELIIDSRSSTYAGVWHPDPEKTVGVRVFQEREGVRSTITHMSKKYRGELTRLLLEHKAANSPQEVQAIANKKFTTELINPSDRESWYLDLIIRN